MTGKKKAAVKKPKAVSAGTIRIKVKDLRSYEKTKNGWRLSKRDFPEAVHVAEVFRSHGNLEAVIDAKNPRFLKGQFSPDRKCQGARIPILPDGRKLDKAYSLFAKHLTIHDESSNDHWDVLYRNPGGTYSYVYTIDKKKKFTRKKYREVEIFGKYYPTLEAAVTKALDDKDDPMAVPMYTLLKTRMRVGNEIYYKMHGHKGLTTLKKADITIKGNAVTFRYLSKGGVPREFTDEFPDIYIKRLRHILKGRKPDDFVFTNRSGHPMNDMQFKKAFKLYCSHPFYPHIVRSYYATEKAKEFISMHESVPKKELIDFYRFLAAELGHKRFVKKDHEWKESYNITIHHYIQPEVLDRLDALVKK